MTTYRDFHRRSLDDREGFWADEAKLVHWGKAFSRVLDYSRPPFTKWFVGGETNLCYNAVDRHVARRGDQKALVWISTEVGETRSFTYQELFQEVNRVAAMMQSLGVKTGDLLRVSTRIGHFVNKVWVTENVRPNIVACSHHLSR